MNAIKRNCISPEYQAWEDWRSEGAFFSSQFQGEEQRRYAAEAHRITQEYGL